MPSTNEDSGLRAALWATVGTGAVLTLSSPLLPAAFGLGRGGVIGVALGAGIAAFNLWALGRIVRAFMNGAGLPWVLLGAFKLVGLLLVVGVVLKLGITTVIPLALGYCALPVGIVLAQLSPAPERARVAPGVDAGVLPDSSSESR